MFVLNETEDVLAKPIKPYKPSQCTPLFFNAYKMRGVSLIFILPRVVLYSKAFTYSFLASATHYINTLY